MAILTDLNDPRVRDVTVTYVEVAPDMRSAKVHVSIMGDETKERLSLRGLQNSAGFLQSKVANRIDTRYTPRLEFVLDRGVKKSLEIAAILQRVLPKEQPTDDEPVDAAEDEDDVVYDEDESLDEQDSSDEQVSLDAETESEGSAAGESSETSAEHAPDARHP